MRRIIAIVTFLMVGNAFAAPYVTNVVAKPRYPWGIVDISCEVKGLEEKDKGLEFTVDAVSSNNSGITNKTSHVYFRGEKKGLFCIMGHGHRNGKRRTSQLSAA